MRDLYQAFFDLDIAQVNLTLSPEDKWRGADEAVIEAAELAGTRVRMFEQNAYDFVELLRANKNQVPLTPQDFFDLVNGPARQTYVIPWKTFDLRVREYEIIVPSNRIRPWCQSEFLLFFKKDTRIFHA